MKEHYSSAAAYELAVHWGLETGITLRLKTERERNEWIQQESKRIREGKR